MISAIHYPCPLIYRTSEKELVDRLTEADKQLILQAFVKNKEELEHQIAESNKVGDKILILTDPLCTLDVRERICTVTLSKCMKKRAPSLLNRIPEMNWITGSFLWNIRSLMHPCLWKC